ncbi:MAG: hypothetical protein SCM96_11180 [Acidobacteriota bacterium]|nr:hypothetical protein [Acidobacteriota bacterium]
MFATPVLTAPSARMIEDSISKEGLPFWAFYLLLSIILLLLIFIFLRDKDLRRRLSAFLSRARRKMIRFRLSLKIKREKHACADLRKDLGKKIWAEGLPIEGTADIREQLKAYDAEKSLLQSTWQETCSRIESLTKEAEAERTRAGGLIEERKTAIRELEEKIRATAAAAKKESGDPGESEESLRLKTILGEIRVIQDEAEKTAGGFAANIKELEKERDRIQKNIIDLRRRTKPLFESLGRAADKTRPAFKDLGVIYFQLDSVHNAIRELQQKIDKLR